MKNLAGRTAILTGASGGLGEFIAEALAKQGINLFLIAFPGDGLTKVRESVARYNVKASHAVLDLRNVDDRQKLVKDAVAELGQVDILINNAGIEFNSFYHELSHSQIAEVLNVNLEAPMMLTRLLLPDMLRRGTGHIVNMSSLAGKSGPAFQEPYAASKAALTAFTYSLRATYAGTGVSASVICPGFVEAGIYTRLKAQTGCAAPLLLGACAPRRVADAVVRAVRRDLPEIIVTRYPVRPLLAVSALIPSLGAWLISRTGVHEFFRKAVRAQAAKSGPSTGSRTEQAALASAQRTTRESTVTK